MNDQAIPRDRMEAKALEVAREVGFSHSAPRERAFVRHYDAQTRAWYEEGVFTWARGTVRVESRSLDVTVERKP